jgi:hypothetical protein
MAIIPDMTLESNSNITINFNGGELSSDSGLLLPVEFVKKSGIDSLIQNTLAVPDEAPQTKFGRGTIALQSIRQNLAGYFNDSDATDLRRDPVLTAALGTDALASQPTTSRFRSAMGDSEIGTLNDVIKGMRTIAYGIEPPRIVVLDLDSTLFPTYGKQGGAAFNFHYMSEGYHPLLMFDAVTGDLIKAELRQGAKYCGNGAADFIVPVLEERGKDRPETSLFFRGDSGFAEPKLYTALETNGVYYAIKLKDNVGLDSAPEVLAPCDEVYELVREGRLDAAEVYGEIQYRAGSWPYERRVVVRIEKPYGSFCAHATFIVTNMVDASPEDVFKFYCKRGAAENLIKEAKNGFDFGKTPSREMNVNACRMLLRAIAYNCFNYFKRLVLPESMSNMTADTVRLRLFKIASKIVRHARRIEFRLCSGCPYAGEFALTLENTA